MININLLPKKERGKSDFDPSLRLFVVALAISLAVVAGLYFKNARDEARLRAQVEALTAQRRALDAVSREFAAIERQKKELKARIAIIDGIKQGREVAPRMLYDIASLMTDNLWLRRLHKDDAKFDIEGRSADNESICSFTEGLSRLPYLRSVELKSVEDVAETGVTVKKFVIEGTVAS
jgi:Tfp pilus assembly protein PilN